MFRSLKSEPKPTAITVPLPECVNRGDRFAVDRAIASPPETSHAFSTGIFGQRSLIINEPCRSRFPPRISNLERRKQFIGGAVSVLGRIEDQKLSAVFHVIDQSFAEILRDRLAWDKSPPKHRRRTRLLLPGEWCSSRGHRFSAAKSIVPASRSRCRFRLSYRRPWKAARSKPCDR